jgi:hypothetical protein
MSLPDLWMLRKHQHRRITGPRNQELYYESIRIGTSADSQHEKSGDSQTSVGKKLRLIVPIPS